MLTEKAEIVRDRQRATDRSATPITRAAPQRAIKHVRASLARWLVKLGHNHDLLGKDSEPDSPQSMSVQGGGLP